MVCAGSVVLHRHCSLVLQAAATTTAVGIAATKVHAPGSSLAAATRLCWPSSRVRLRLRCRFRVRQRHASWHLLPRRPGTRGLAVTRTCCSASSGNSLLLCCCATAAVSPFYLTSLCLLQHVSLQHLHALSRSRSGEALRLIPAARVARLLLTRAVSQAVLPNATRSRCCSLEDRHRVQRETHTIAENPWGQSPVGPGDLLRCKAPQSHPTTSVADFHHETTRP